MASAAELYLSRSRGIPPKPMINIERNIYSFFSKEDADPQACWEERKRQAAAKVAVPPQNLPSEKNSQGSTPLLPHQISRSQSSGGSLSSKSSTPSSSMHSYMCQQYATQMDKDAHVSSWISNAVLGMSEMEDIQGYKDDRNQNQTPQPASTEGSSRVSLLSEASQQSAELGTRPVQSRKAPTDKGRHVHYAHIGSYIRDSFQNGKICDMCFRVGDEMILLHKVVLACHSPYFAEIFETEEFNLQPRMPKQVIIRGASVKAVKLFIEYMYNGNIAIDTAEIPDIMKLAKIFGVEEIRKLYYKRVKQLDNEELLKLLPVSKTAADTEFCDCIMKIIAKRFIQATQCHAFFDMDIDTLCMVLSHDTLNVTSEMDVFCAGVAWMNHHNSEERAKHLEKIMECIRFPLMSNKEMFTCYKKCPMLRTSSLCVEMITVANWVQTSLSLQEQDPLDIDVPNQRNSIDSSSSVSSYLSRHSSSDIECTKPDIEVEVSHMPEDLASDFNMHAYMRSSVSSSSVSDKCVVHQYRKSKSEEIGHEGKMHAQRERARMKFDADQRKRNDALLRRVADKEEVSRKQDALNSREKATGRELGTTAEGRDKPHKRKTVEQTQERVGQSTTSDKEKKQSMIWEGNHWYLIGGTMYKGKEKTPYPKKEVLVYNYETKRWKSLAPMKEARMQHALCVEDGRIYAIGGIGEGNRLLNSVECYDTRHNCWFFVKALPEPRAGARATAENGNIYLSGGYGCLSNGQTYSISDTVTYNEEFNKWTKKREQTRHKLKSLFWL